MCRTCVDGICTNGCQKRKLQRIEVSVETNLKFEGLKYARQTGLSIEQYQDCYQVWEDAVIGCGITPSITNLAELQEAIDDYLKFNI